MDPRRVALFLRRDHADYPRVETHRGDDALAVLQLELLLNRLAVAGRGRHIDEARRVRDAEVREEHAARARAPGERREHGIALTQPRRRQILHFLLPLHPAVARDDDDVVFFDDEIIGRVLRLAGIAGDRGAPLVAIPGAHFVELAAHQLPPRVLVLEQRVDLARALALLLEPVADDEDFNLPQPVALQLENRVGLFG